ncbi:DNA-binding protein, partial [Streptomyces parvus]
MGPLAGELTSSLIGRVAGRYGMERGEVLSQWSLTGSPARHPGGGGVRADAEVVLN